MNKKFLTALLLGAFTIASTSTLVSCKDYDDDIDALQEQINQNDASIKALQASLQSTKTALETEISNLRGELATEAARAKQAEQALSQSLLDAKSELNQSISNEQARALAAEGKLDDAILGEVKRATGAEAALEARIKTAEDAIETINKALDTKVNVADFNQFVDEINAKVKALGEDLADAQAKLQKAIDDEAARAQKAEEEILGKLSDEAKAREDADKAEKDARELAVAALQQQDEALKAFDEKIDGRVKAIEADYLKASDKQELKDLIDQAKKDLEAKIAAAKTEVLSELDKQKNELTTLIATEKAALEGKITALDAKLTKAIDDEKSARDAADKKEEQARIAAINDLKGQFDAEVISLQNQINKLVDQLKEDVETLKGLIEKAQAAADKANADLSKEIARAKEEEGKLREDLNTEIGLRSTLRQEFDQEVADRVAAINQEIADRTAAVKAVSDKLDLISALLSKALRGLVLEPKLYYHGIDAIDASKFEYNAVTGLGKANPDGDNSADKPTYSATLTQIIPDLTATYHMNPSNAVLDTDPANYSFATLNREYTRTVFPNTIKTKVYKASVSGGKLTVKANVSNVEYLQNIAADDAVTVLALQYKQAGKNGAADTVITSNYAALKAYKYNNVVLNNASLAPKSSATRPHAHLWTKAIDAINEVYDEANNAATGFIVPINWDSKGINLFDLVNSHRDVINGSSTQTDVAWDSKASTEELKEYGLKYSFELLGYFVGGNKTSESAHAVLVNNTTIVPVAPKADGKSQSANTIDAAVALQNRGAELGREPLVRVTLTDTVSNKIVQVGYIKFHITEKAVTPDPEVITYKTISYDWTDNYTVVCNPANSLNKKLTWNQIEADILGDINQSSSEFRANYAIDGTGNIFTQYNGNGAGATVVTPGYGEVKHETETSPSGANTDVISWVVTNATAWAQFKTANKTEIVTYVRFKKNGTWSGVGREDAYIEAPNYLVVKLTWKPGARNMDPKTEFNSVKIAQYWHGAGEIEASTGFDNIWGNVEVPGTTVPVAGKATADADDEFVFDIKNGLEGNQFKVADIAGYSALNGAKTVSVYFATPDVTSVKGSDGNTYTLSVSGTSTSPSELRATRSGTTKVIAKMETTGANMGIVTYQDNDFAKAVLNYAGRKQQGPGQTLTAKVQVVVTTCAPANNVTVDKNTFNVKFIRPVNAENGEVALVDAVDGGSVAAITMAFTDWRGLWSTTPYNYFNYYGVTTLTVPNTGTNADGSVKIDPSKVTTTLNGGKLGDVVDGINTTTNGTTLKSKTSNLVFSYYAPATVGVAATRTIHGKTVQDKGYGVVVYENNGTPVDDFQLRIPMTVTYDWGQFTTYIDASVAKTIGVKKQ